jgi:hypothetical protein
MKQLKKVILILILIIFSCEESLESKIDDDFKLPQYEMNIISPENNRYYIGQINVVAEIDSTIFNDNDMRFYFQIIERPNNTYSMYKSSSKRISGSFYAYTNSFQNGKYTIVITVEKRDYKYEQERYRIYSKDSISFFIDSSPLSTINLLSVNSVDGKANLKWEKSDSKTFQSYEIQRSKNSSYNYQTIMTIDDITKTSFSDNESSDIYGPNIFYYRVRVTNGYESKTSNTLSYSRGETLDFVIFNRGKFNSKTNTYYFFEYHKQKVYGIKPDGVIISSSTSINSNLVYLSNNQDEVISFHGNNIKFLNSNNLSLKHNFDIPNSYNTQYLLDNASRVVSIQSNNIYLYNKSNDSLIHSKSANFYHSYFASFKTSSSTFVIIPLNLSSSNLYVFDIKSDTIHQESSISLSNPGTVSNYFDSKNKILFTTSNTNIYKMNIDSDNKFEQINGLSIPSNYQIRKIQTNENEIILLLIGNYYVSYKSLIIKYSKTNFFEIKRYSFVENIIDFYVTPDSKLIFSTNGSNTYKLQ